MPRSRALRVTLFTGTLAALLVATGLMPIAPSPAEASTAGLTVSGRIVAAPSSTSAVEHYDFSVSLNGGGTNEYVAYEQFRGPDFSITAPKAGTYTLRIGSVATDEPSPWIGAWFGDTPFSWHATAITVDGTTPVTGLVVTVTKASSVSGEITAPPAGLNYGLTASAYLHDPVTGGYEFITMAQRDFNGPYTIHGLPRGKYLIRFGHDGEGGASGQRPAYPSEFYPGSRYLDKARLVDVGAASDVTGIDGTLDYWSFDVGRTAGATRYETAVRLSAAEFKPGVAAVYLASGTAWADALSAAPAAAHRDSPLLLTAPNGVPTVVLTELARLKPSEVVVAGGPGAVSNSVVTSLRAEGYSVRRVAGADRYETSRRLAADAFANAPKGRQVWLATGRGFADALSAAADAGRRGGPLVLVDGESRAIDAATLTTLTDLRVTELAIAGGPAAISERYAASLPPAFRGVSVHRYGGSDRYETSRLIADQSFSSTFSSPGRAFLAMGTDFADALAAAPIAGSSGSRLVLVPGSCIPAATRTTLIERDSFNIRLVGGPGVLGAGVQNMSTC